MNIMEDAFARAGAPIKSLRERTWQLIKDRGPLTVKSLATMTGEDEVRVASAVSQLRVNRRVSSKRGAGRGAPATYTANGATYEEAKSFREPTKVTDIRPNLTTATAPATTPKAATLGSIPKELEHYTIAQLRTLHNTLNAIFSGDR